MFARSQQLSSPLILPTLGSILATSVVACLLVLPPMGATLSLRQLLLRSTFDLLLAACIHAVTVGLIWRVIRDYVEPSATTLGVHIWAAVVWLPLIVILNAGSSQWVACIVPWAFANVITFLSLWSVIPQVDEGPVCIDRVLFQQPSTVPLWRTLLPFCVIIVILQAGLAAAFSGHPWSAAALISAGVLLLPARHRPMQSMANRRRKFSNYSLLQTAAAFFLISTALTPYVQGAYGLWSLASFLAARPIANGPLAKLAPRPDYSGIILTLPAKPHPPIVPPKRSDRTDFSTALAKPLVISFDGAYWYFKQPATRPAHDALTERGDPIDANIHSTDRRELAMEAHQTLANSISGDCCRSVRINLLNGDNRAGVIEVELTLNDTSTHPASSLHLGSLPLTSSEIRHIPLNRPPVAESLSFRMPAEAHGRRFNEITVAIKPSSERALAGSKIAIQDFTLIP